MRLWPQELPPTLDEIFDGSGINFLKFVWKQWALASRRWMEPGAAIASICSCDATASVVHS